ncbi:hypothetical protein ABZ508_28660 [Streptomyces lavendulocolor]|uniref:Uncharacterized protein n=1 Tax=Streptomyces lavendulocolor TaxID=67316 RepID=A0ABV2WDA1_9ACTN
MSRQHMAVLAHVVARAAAKRWAAGNGLTAGQTMLLAWAAGTLASVVVLRI